MKGRRGEGTKGLRGKTWRTHNNFSPLMTANNSTTLLQHLPPSLRPSVPHSLSPSVPQMSLSPSVPQSLSPSVPQSLSPPFPFKIMTRHE